MGDQILATKARAWSGPSNHTLSNLPSRSFQLPDFLHFLATIHHLLLPSLISAIVHVPQGLDIDHILRFPLPYPHHDRCPLPDCEKPRFDIELRLFRSIRHGDSSLQRRLRTKMTRYKPGWRLRSQLRLRPSREQSPTNQFHLNIISHASSATTIMLRKFQRKIREVFLPKSYYLQRRKRSRSRRRRSWRKRNTWT